MAHHTDGFIFGAPDHCQNQEIPEVSYIIEKQDPFQYICTYLQENQSDCLGKIQETPTITSIIITKFINS